MITDFSLFLQVNNPVSVLTQEMSKYFLHSKGEGDKYKVWSNICHLLLQQCYLNTSAYLNISSDAWNWWFLSFGLALFLVLNLYSPVKVVPEANVLAKVDVLFHGPTRLG